METQNSETNNEANNENRLNENSQRVLPAKRFSTGAISATVWKNARKSTDGKSFESCTVNLQRSYTNKQGQWQSTNSLRLNDLPRATLVLEEAYKYLVMQAKGEAE